MTSTAILEELIAKQVILFNCKNQRNARKSFCMCYDVNTTPEGMLNSMSRLINQYNVKSLRVRVKRGNGMAEAGKRAKRGRIEIKNY